MTDAPTSELPDALTGEKAIQTVKADPSSVLLKPELWDRFFAAIKKSLSETPADLSTEAGRKALASKAYSVVRTKTAVDGAAKKLKSSINERQQKIIRLLDDLATETRAPLTAWEEAEEKRANLRKEIVDRILRLAKIEWNDTSDAVINRLTDIECVELDPAIFGDELEQARATLAQAVETMNAAVDRLEKAEADQRELDRLREEAAERQRLADLKAEEDAAAEREAQRLADEVAAQKAAAVVKTGPSSDVVADPIAQPIPREEITITSLGGGAFIGTSYGRIPVEPEPIHAATVAALIEFSGLTRDAAWRVVEDIAEGRIPNVTFSKET